MVNQIMKKTKKMILMQLSVAYVLNPPIPLALWFSVIDVKFGYIWTVSGNRKTL
jgi:hypothetical protein